MRSAQSAVSLGAPPRLLVLIAVSGLALMASCSRDSRGLGPIEAGTIAGGGGVATGGRSGLGSGGVDATGGGGLAPGGMIGGGGGGGGGNAGGGGGATGGGKGTGGSGAGGVTSGSGGADAEVAARPECDTADDCRLDDDCCNCRAVPRSGPRTECALDCDETQCTQQQRPDRPLECVAGRCVAGFNCDSSHVTCRQATPACPAGQVPGLNPAGSCYQGGCVPVTQCQSVRSCAACGGADQACVTMRDFSGSQSHCVVIPTSCQGAATCGCFGPSTCAEPFSTCTPLSGVQGVSCFCPNC